MNNPRVVTKDNFWKRVTKTDNCWMWNGPKRHDQMGHGFFNQNGHRVYAHRFAWEITFGAIPRGLCVCHKCDVPQCVNPKHLFLGTRRDNALDMVRKGRQAKGTQRWGCRFTEEEVYAIRALPKATRSAARQLNLPWVTVWSIWNRRTWRHLPEVA